MDMSLITAALDLVSQGYDIYKSIKEILEDQMLEFLKKVGKIDYNAAIQHLDNARRTPAKANDYVLLASGSFEAV